MVVPPMGCRAGGPSRARQGDDGPWRREPERSRGDVPGRVARDPRCRSEASGELCPRRGGRGRDRVAALPADRAPARGAIRPPQNPRDLHALRIPGAGRPGHDVPRRQGRDRMRAGVERGALGARTEEGHPFEQQGACGQPGVAPRGSARDARLAGRERPGDRRLRRQGAPAVGERKDDDRRSGATPRREGRQAGAGRECMGA